MVAAAINKTDTCLITPRILWVSFCRYLEGFHLQMINTLPPKEESVITRQLLEQTASVSSDRLPMRHQPRGEPVVFQWVWLGLQLFCVFSPSPEGGHQHRAQKTNEFRAAV